MIPHDTHLQIGSLLFDGLDQIDLTGPFEVLSRIPNSTYRLYGKTADPVRDLRGLRLTPDATLAEAPPLDVLHVPGGFGQEALMEDEEVLGWIRRQAAGARASSRSARARCSAGRRGCSGRRATTHWASFHLLPFFGATPVNERVVVDGNWVFAAGVTAGIDGALRLAAELRGDDAAQAIQLYMVYAPEPPFNSGTPETAPAAILNEARQSVHGITAQREQTARRVAARLGIDVDWRETRVVWHSRPDEPAIDWPRQSRRRHDQAMTFTRRHPEWLLSFWKEIDDKTFGQGFDCFTEDAVCNLGVADWHGREAIRENLRSFIDKGFAAHHDVVE